MEKKIISQKKLAKVLGVSCPALNKILAGRGRPSLQRAQKLEACTGISRLVWLYASSPVLTQTLEEVYGEIKRYGGKRDVAGQE